MSKETSAWLNQNCLIGFTDERGQAWHYRAEDQGSESNHYPGAIPLDDIVRRLFNFEVQERPVYYLMNADAVELGAAPEFAPSQAGRKGMLASDNGYDLGAFKDGYQGHGYNEWLLENVATILDDDLAIGSAGLLRKRGVAWVSVEMPETLHAEGVGYRPHLLATTSFDGSIATTYGRKVTFTVCDNTLSAALGESGQELKIRHSRHSGLRITDAREALAIVHSMGEDFARELAHLTAWRIEDSQFGKVLDILVPVPGEKGRGQTLATRKRDELTTLYRTDVRAATWNGTALGVLQAFNTWNHHYAAIRGEANRGQRNAEAAITGRQAAADAKVLTVLADVAPNVTAQDGLVAIGA